MADSAFFIVWQLPALVETSQHVIRVSDGRYAMLDLSLAAISWFASSIQRFDHIQPRSHHRIVTALFQQIRRQGSGLWKPSSFEVPFN